MSNLKEIFHYKLVRDKIPEIIMNEGKEPTIKQIQDDQEYLRLLVIKLLEEVKEFQASLEQEELADIFEVLDAILNISQLPMRHITYLRKLKLAERGGFSQRYYLVSVKE